MHCIDEATRFSMCWEVADKTSDSLIKAFTRGWSRLHGAPDQIVSDGEGALTSEAWGRWCDRHDCKRIILSDDEHGWVVEKHNDLLRGILNRMTEAIL